MSWITSCLYYNKCNVVVIVGYKIFIDLFDVLCTLVVFITWAIGICLIYTPEPEDCRPYQANPSCPCYNYIHTQVSGINI